MNKCEKCGGMHWRTAPCVQSKKSTAALTEVQAITASLIDGNALDARSQKPLAAGTQALPVDTNPVSGEEGFTPFASTPELLTVPDRRAGDKDDQLTPKKKRAPNGTFDKKAWMREYMRPYMQRLRAKKKAEREVK